MLKDAPPPPAHSSLAIILARYLIGYITIRALHTFKLRRVSLKSGIKEYVRITDHT